MKEIPWDWWEHKSVAVLGEGVVDAVYHEVAGKHPLVLGNHFHPPVLAMEEESVAEVFKKTPYYNADEDLKNVGYQRVFRVFDDLPNRPG